MTGRRPSIRTRVEFESELLMAVQQAEGRLARSPGWASMQVVVRQLRAMREWTEEGRTPTEDERKRVNIGLIAVREFDDDEEMASLCHRLNYFVQEWPLGEEP